MRDVENEEYEEEAVSDELDVDEGEPSEMHT
jgi:hypothetical protein